MSSSPSPPPWFRVYNSVISSPKLFRLPEEVRWRWIGCLAIANQNNERGDLPCLEDVAFYLRIDTVTASATLDILLNAGLLDKIQGSKKLRIHNWNGRQFASDTSRERTKRYRERLRDVTRDVKCDVTVTPRAHSESESESETDTESSSPTSSSCERSPANGRKLETTTEKLETTTTENEPPEFPESGGMFIVMPGDHPMDELDAREIWGAIWRAWKNPRLCFTFYEHQQWVSKTGWMYAIKTAIKTNGRPCSIKYLETIGVDFDVNGPKPEHPVQRGAVGTVPYKPQGPPVPAVVPMTEEQRLAALAESRRLLDEYRKRMKKS